jgi:glycogen debranching enzyme
MRQRLLPYWRKQFSTFAEMLEAAEHDYPSLTKRAEQFDAELEHDLIQEGGAEYAAIAILAYRQAIGAHKLVEDDAGVPFFMPKENFSNGSISTVDVLYPSSPMFLLLNPKLVEAQLEPVMRYAETSHWKFPFAPHDLGVYPLANGQLYGGGESSEEDQMPVEESGNMILMIAALSDAEHDTTFAKRYWPVVTKWADFLLAKGFDPEKQLCTDDFAGHLAHNTNLSIKAIEALAAYAKLARKLGDEATAKRYEAAAKSMADKWGSMALDGDHNRLAFDKGGTWSQKYNLVWDTILDLHMFSPQIAQREVAFYKTHLNPYGLPLDNRATYTKLDWTIWSATLASNPEDFKALVSPIFHFLDKTPERIPMTDWYDTVSAKHPGFQARSVVGGVYIKMLADPQMWSKWASRSSAQR